MIRSLLLLSSLVSFLFGSLGSIVIAPDDTGDDSFSTWGAEPRPLPEDAAQMVVDRVVDGDTLNLTFPDDDWFYSVRIIGIDSPEKDGPYTDEECFGTESSTELMRLLPKGTIVYVEQDVSDEDRSGRWLRHVWLPFADEDGINVEGDAYLVSEILVLGGFADARSYEPDVVYDDILKDAEGEAREDDSGFWGAC